MESFSKPEIRICPTSLLRSYQQKPMECTFILSVSFLGLSLNVSDDRFLWAKLQLQDISRKRTDRAIRDAVDRAPQGLVEKYKSTIEKIMTLPSDERRLIKSLFEWIVLAVRPLSVTELSICVTAINLKETSINEDV